MRYLFMFLLLLLVGCVEYYPMDSSHVRGELVNVEDLGDTHEFKIKQNQKTKKFNIDIDNGLCVGQIEVYVMDVYEVSSLDGMVPCTDGTIFNFVESSGFVQNTSTKRKYKIKDMGWSRDS